MNSPPKILIVEDESIVAFNLQQRLLQMGYDVAGVAESGQESLALAAEHKPDLVLMDIHIKGEMDGIEVASHLSAGNATPVVYLTAYSEDTTLERARQTRPYGYLIKPFSERELHATIQMALERHQVQQALIDNQRLLKQALEAATMGTLEADADLCLVRLGGASAQRLGVSEHARLPMSDILAVIHEDDRVVMAQRLMGQTLGRFSQEFRTIDEKAGTRWLKFDASVLEKGHTSGVVQDITASKLAERRLLQINEELEARVQERTTELRHSLTELEAFNYTVAHDLRSPIRAISGLSEILIEEHGETIGEEGRQTLERMANSAQRMGSLIDALLNMSRLSRQALQPRPVNLSQLASELVPILCESAPQRQARFDIEPDLQVQGDPALLRSVIDNLLRNAWKFSSKKPETHITLGRTEQDGKPVYFVRDNGCGFDAAHAERLFNPFYRLHSEREFSGTGLGLSIVQRIIARHGGRVWADATPGEGATFYFTLGE